MDLQDIFIGTSPNDKTGTPARQAGQMINANFAYLNGKIDRKDGIVASTGLTVVGQDATMNAFWEWIIDTVEYTNPYAVVLNFPLATTGNSRLDMIALTTSNTAIRIAGTESVSNPISPVLPDNMLQASLVLITDASVGTPLIPIIGDTFVKKLESQDFIANYGATLVIDQINLIDDRSSISLVGSATDVKSVQLSGEFIRAGKPHFFKNRTGHDVKLWHLAGTGNVKYFFPNGLDLIVKPNEVIQFHTNANDSGNVRYEYVGNITDYIQHFKGVFATFAALVSAVPTAIAGDYAQVNEAGATDVVNYNWDVEESIWVVGGSGGGAVNTDSLPEGSTNLYFTTSRVLATVLTGISFITGTAITAADSILVALGKLQRQVTDILASIALKANVNSPSLAGVPEAPTATIGNNTNQIATTKFVMENASNPAPKAAVCFTFDDSFVSLYNQLAVPFESRGVRFSQAVTFSYLGGTGKMSTAQVLDLQSRGFEVLNHTSTHMDLRDGTATTYANAVSEISGGHTSLNGVGLIPKGFVSANSEIKREFFPIIDNLYDNAYTLNYGIGAGIANPDIQVMNSPIYAIRMTRTSLYQHNVAQCKIIIDRAVATNGIVTFYDHDPGGVYYASSASAADILEVLDYAIAAVGVANVIKSSEIASRFNAVKSGGGLYVDFKTSQSFANATFTATQLNYDVESRNIKAEINGTFTVKKSGTYNIEGAWYFASATAIRTVSAIEVDGTGIYRNRRNGYGSIGGSSTQSYSGIMNCTMTLVKGQTFKLFLFQDSGAARSILGGVYDYAKITRVD